MQELYSHNILLFILHRWFLSIGDLPLYAGTGIVERLVDDVVLLADVLGPVLGLRELDPVAAEETLDHIRTLVHRAPRQRSLGRGDGVDVNDDVIWRYGRL